MADLVIGSGPAGVSVAKALLARGRSVVMIDAGETLEPEHEALRARLGAATPDGWAAADVAAYRAAQENLPPGAVRRYGSDYFFRDGEGLLAETPDWLGLRPSFALGGLSNAWGSAVTPYRAEDLAGWPIGIEDLAPHYRAVADFMPVSGEVDALQAVFPAYDLTGAKPLPGSTQGEALLARLKAHAADLAGQGVFAGRARQAVAPGCHSCGLCLMGCPYQLIFSARSTVTAMREHPAFDYRPGLRALAFAEDADGVTVTCKAPSGAETLRGDRLFVAAGVLSTVQIVLASLAPREEAVLKDSQHFFLPLLHLWRAPGDPANEPRHALTQAFVEIADPAVSPHTVHAQLYTYNPVYAEDMKARYGARVPILNPLFDALGRRLIVAQTFLHSDHSHSIGLRLAPDGRLQPRLVANPETDAAMARARGRMAKAMAKVGLLALTPASRPGAPGSSFHAGGTFPMAAAPQGLQTDILGRPAGLKRTHLADASVLPAVPATTITFSVMANAHRIAAAAPVP